MRLTKTHWIAAGLVAVLVHVAAFVSLRAPSSGEPPGGTGPQVQVVGSAAQVFGTDERQPEDPAPAPTEESPQEISAEPPGARAEELGPERIAPEADARPVRQAEAEPANQPKRENAPEAPVNDAVAPEPAQAIPAESAESAVLPATQEVEAEPDGVAMPVRRPAPTEAERRPVRKPQRTTRNPSKEEGKPRRQRSGTGRGQRQSGSRAASEQRGSARRRASASTGEVRRYAGIIRARIARNRPSSRGRRGTAVVRFAIARSGGLRYSRLVRSSGNRSLDRAALGSVRRAAPFPRPPRGMSAGQRTFSIPFRFR